VQSQIAIGSGGLFGRGPGASVQKDLWLPEASTDFILAVVGEELGFVGIVLLCAAYLTLVVRGVRAALRAPDDYGSYLAYGIAAMFGIQALVNLAVALAILPTKGLTLPFVSFGGSSLLVNAAAAGVLLNISRQGPEPLPSEETAPPPVVEATS
jgi:cell division protein FtsW